MNLKRTWTVLVLSLAFASMVRAHPGPGVVVDGKGQVYFVHGVQNRIMKVDAEGKLSVFYEDKEGKQLPNPHHLVLDKDGNLYAASDRGSTKVWKLSPDAKLTQVYPPADWYGIGFVGAGGDPFTLDADGNLYCINYRQFKHAQVLKIAADGRISSLAGGDWGYADGKGTGAQFRDLHWAAFAWGPDGALHLTDSGSAIRKITKDGTVTTLAGGKDEGYTDGPAKDARFKRAIGLTFDAKGNLYVAEFGNRRIRKITPDGQVSTLAGSGGRGMKDGPALEATFEAPCGVAVGKDGTVYVLDYVERLDKPVLRKISPGGKVATIARVE